MEHWTTSATLTTGDSAFAVSFDWDNEIGVPGAFIIRNNHHSEFYLKTLTLEDVLGHGRIHFVCNSWVYPAKRYKKDRIFFVNHVSQGIGCDIFDMEIGDNIHNVTSFFICIDISTR